MRFVMYVNETEVDAIEMPVGKFNLSGLMQEMKNKYRELLKETGAEPVFALEQVASSINAFQPLQANEGRNEEGSMVSSSSRAARS